MTVRRPFIALLVLAAIAITFVAQYLLSPEHPSGPGPWVLFLGAIALFYIAYAESQREPVAVAEEKTGWHWQSLFERSSPFPWLLTVLAVAASVFAATDSVADGHDPSYALAIGVWLVGIILLIAAYVPWVQVRALNREQFKALWVRTRNAWPEIAAVSAVVLLALILRAYDLEHIPLNLGGDEAEMGLEARGFLTGQLGNPFGTGFWSHPSMFFFLQSLVMRVFGSTITGLRLFSALLGTLAVPMSYLLVKKLHGRTLAFMVAILLAAYPFQIHFSRLGLNNIGDPVWAATVFFLTIEAVDTRNKLYFVLAGLALGFSQYFYFGVRLVPIVLGLFVLYWLITDRRKILSQWPSFLLMGLSALVILLPLLLLWSRSSEAFWGRYAAMGIFPSGWLNQEVQRTGQSAVMILLDRTRRSFLNFIALPDTAGFYNTGQPLLDRFSAVLAIFGFADAIYRIKQKGYLLFVIWFILAVITGGVLVLEEAGSARLLTTTIPLMFFVALGVYRLADIFKNSLQWTVRTQRIVMAASVAALVLLGIRFYFVDYTPRRSYGYDGTWMFTELARYLKAQPSDYKAYFFGAPYVYIGHGTIRYIAPNINGMDVIDPIKGPPNFVDPNRRAIFMFYPPRASELQYVEAAYPNGQERAIAKPNGDELLLIYTVDKPAAQNVIK